MVDVSSMMTAYTWTLWGTIVFGVVSFALTIYTVYLNYKQAKVQGQMDKLIQATEQTNEILLRMERKL